jgi:hypothetical protein
MTGPYVVEVETATHDDLRAGVTAAPARNGIGPDYSVVVIAAAEVGSDAEAMLLAAQLAHTTSGRMPTRTTLISWPH